MKFFDFLMVLFQLFELSGGYSPSERYRMWDMSDCTCMASGECRFLGNFFDLNFISMTFERKSKVLKVFLDMSVVI